MRLTQLLTISCTPYLALTFFLSPPAQFPGSSCQCGCPPGTAQCQPCLSSMCLPPLNPSYSVGSMLPFSHPLPQSPVYVQPRGTPGEIPIGAPPPILWNPPRLPPLDMTGMLNLRPPAQLYPEENAPDVHRKALHYFHVSETTPLITDAPLMVLPTETPLNSFERSETTTKIMDITIESHPKVEEQAQLGLTFAPSQDEFKNESPAATTFDVAESPLDNFFYPEDVADITQTTTISSTSIDYEEVYAQKRIAENKSTTEVIQAITDETPPADDKLRPPIYVEASHFETFEPAVETVTVDVTINYTNTNSEPENENDNLDTSTTEVAYVENYSLRQREDPQRKMKDVAVTQPADAFWTFPQEDLHAVKPAKAFRGLNSMIVQKHRESGVVGKQSLREATGKRQSVLVDVFRKEKFKHSFGRKRDREGQKPKCNSAALWNIMEQKMSTSASASKQVLYSAVLARFPGRIASVICSRFSFSYIVVTSPIYCEHRKTPLTCFAFIQP